MDLVIKISNKCNFKCDFCASNMIGGNKEILPVEKVESFLIQYPIERVIVNGGDPLCIDPQYYYDLLKFIEDNFLQTNLSFTTNLYDFWINPTKCTNLFKHSRVSVC